MSKGIEPLMAGVILVLITVAAWSVVSGWLQMTSREHASAIENRTEKKLQCAYADLYIDRAQVNCSGNCTAGEHTVQVWVKNSGEISIGIDRINILSASGELFTLLLNRTATLYVGDLLNLTNTSSLDCTGFNASSKIDEVTIISRDCPDTYDSFDGSDVTFVEC